MNPNKVSTSSRDSQWKDVKVGGGSRSELTKVVAQIRSQVRDESKIFSIKPSSLVEKKK